MGKSKKKMKKAVGWSPIRKSTPRDAVGKIAYERKGKPSSYDPLRDARRKSKAVPKEVSHIRFQGGNLVISGQPYAGDNKKVYYIVRGKKRQRVAVRALFATRKEAEEYLKKFLQPKHPRAHFEIKEGWI